MVELLQHFPVIEMYIFWVQVTLAFWDLMMELVFLFCGLVSMTNSFTRFQSEFDYRNMDIVSLVLTCYSTIH